MKWFKKMVIKIIAEYMQNYLDVMNAQAEVLRDLVDKSDRLRNMILQVESRFQSDLGGLKIFIDKSLTKKDITDIVEHKIRLFECDYDAKLDGLRIYVNDKTLETGLGEIFVKETLNNYHKSFRSDIHNLEERTSGLEQSKMQLDEGIVSMTRKQLMGFIDQRLDTFENGVNIKLNGLKIYVNDKLCDGGKGSDVEMLKKLARMEPENGE